MSERWVVNASPLILLAKVAHVDWLHRMPDELVIPAGVAAEVDQIPHADPAKVWLTGEGAKWIRPNAPVDPLVAAWDLGLGETAVLSWARTRSGFEAVVDDGAARKCANALSVAVRGTLGIVVLAKRRGLVSHAGPILEQLMKAGYYVAPPLVAQALVLAGEK